MTSIFKKLKIKELVPSLFKQRISYLQARPWLGVANSFFQFLFEHWLWLPMR